MLRRTSSRRLHGPDRSDRVGGTRLDVPVRCTVFALVLATVLAASAASASAAPYAFRILSGSLTYGTTASGAGGCVSGHRDVTSSLTGTVPDDPQNAFTPGPGETGSIDTRSQTGGTNTSPTTGQFSNDYIDNSCSLPLPCHYDYGITPSNGRSIQMEIIDIGDPTTVKISPSIGPPGVGDVTEGTCGGPIDVHFPFGEPSSTISTASLFSGNPVTLTVAGARHFAQDDLGRAASVDVTYNVSMTVQAINPEDLHITTAAATGEDQGGPSGKWTPSLPLSYADLGCQSPAEHTTTPLAYMIAGPQRDPLTTLLGTKQETLAGAFGFAGRNLKLKRGMTAITPTTVGANGAGWQTVIDAAHTPKGVQPGRGVFYGGRIACKLKSEPASYTTAKSGVYTLCHDQSSLSGEAWTGLLPEMRTGLARLWKILEPLHACYAISSGFRSQDQQDALRRKWHGIADHGAGDKRTATSIHDALKTAGFAQDPAGYNRSSGVAKGGPALFSLHSLGIAADVHVEFSDTGAFAQNVTKLHAAAAQAGLCGPPASDPVHVELPFIPSKDLTTGYPTVASVTPKNGVTPKCSTFTDVPPPKPDVKAPKKQDPLAGLSLEAGASIGASVTASASVSTPGAARVFRLKAVTKLLAAGRTVKLKLKLPRNARAPIAAALRHGRTLNAKVHVVVDYAGATRHRTLTITLLRR